MKTLRLIAGIILHPARLLIANIRRSRLECEIRSNVRKNWCDKNYRRMHEMTDITPTTFTHSELYLNLYHGAEFY